MGSQFLKTLLQGFSINFLPGPSCFDPKCGMAKCLEQAGTSTGTQALTSIMGTDTRFGTDIGIWVWA